MKLIFLLIKFATEKSTDLLCTEVFGTYIFLYNFQINDN